jgi:hypothetical protein
VDGKQQATREATHFEASEGRARARGDWAAHPADTRSGGQRLAAQRTPSPALRNEASGARGKVAASATAALCTALALLVAQPTLANEPLLLDEGRFRVSVSWETAAGATGAGHGVALTADAGYFWFFNPSNVELVVKVLDACTLDGVNRFWFFAAGLTNVGTTITVEDLWADSAKIYESPLGQAFQPITDIAAFATCATPPPLPVASFATDASCPEPGVCDAAIEQQITFTDTSSGPITSRSWDFGDGTTASSAQVVHAYTTAGSFPVELTVGNASGSASASATVVVATGPPLTSLLLDEDFSAGAIPNGWTTSQPARWSVVEGELRTTGTPNGASRGPISYQPGLGWTDYAVSATLAAPELNSAFNLYGRFSSVNDHVVLQMHVNGRASLIRVVDGLGYLLKSTIVGVDEIALPATYRLEFRGVEIVAFRNDKRLFIARDNGAPATGTVGFESFAGTLTVDDVVVEGL